MRKIDSGRHAYYECYTGRHWGSVHEYTMALDTGILGMDTCVDLVARAAQSM